MYSPRAEYLTYLRLLLFPIGHTIPCWLMKSTSTNLFWPHFSFDQPQEIGTTLTPLYWYGNEAQRDEVHLRGYRGHGESKGDWSPIHLIPKSMPLVTAPEPPLVSAACVSNVNPSCCYSSPYAYSRNAHQPMPAWVAASRLADNYKPLAWLNKPLLFTLFQRIMMVWICPKNHSSKSPLAICLCTSDPSFPSFSCVICQKMIGPALPVL